MTDQEPTIDRPDRISDLETVSPKQKLMFFLFTGLVLFVLLGMFWVTSTRKPQQAQKKAPNAKIAKEANFVDVKVKPPVVEPVTQAPPPSIIIPEEKPLRPQTVTLGELTQTVTPVTVPAKPPVDPTYTRKLTSGQMLSGTISTTQGNTAKAPDTSVFTAKASQLKNLNYLIIQGTKISCTMENALDSTIPGYTSCIIAENVYSANGNVILLERGTKVSGEYKSSLEHGQSRLYVQWNRAFSPTGVTIELSSGSGGDLGRAGITGHVNKHWWERFGNALLVSVVADALGYTSDRKDNENFENTESTINEMATIAAESGIKIKPTINVNQGASIIIYVQRDLDFSTIYNLVYDEDRPHD